MRAGPFYSVVGSFEALANGPSASESLRFTATVILQFMLKLKPLMSVYGINVRPSTIVGLCFRC